MWRCTVVCGLHTCGGDGVGEGEGGKGGGLGGEGGTGGTGGGKGGGDGSGEGASGGCEGSGGGIGGGEGGGAGGGEGGGGDGAGDEGGGGEGGGGAGGGGEGGGVIGLGGEGGGGSGGGGEGGGGEGGGGSGGGGEAGGVSGGGATGGLGGHCRPTLASPAKRMRSQQPAACVTVPRRVSKLDTSRKSTRTAVAACVDERSIGAVDLTSGKPVVALVAWKRWPCTPESEYGCAIRPAPSSYESWPTMATESTGAGTPLPPTRRSRKLM